MSFNPFKSIVFLSVLFCLLNSIALVWCRIAFHRFEMGQFEWCLDPKKKKKKPQSKYAKESTQFATISTSH